MSMPLLLLISIYSNSFVSSKIYDKRDNFDFDIGHGNFLFRMVTFRVVPLMECIFLNLKYLLESVAMLVTLMFVINV